MSVKPSEIPRGEAVRAFGYYIDITEKGQNISGEREDNENAGNTAKPGYI